MWLRGNGNFHEYSGLIPGPAQWVKDPELLWNCHEMPVGCIHSSDLVLLGLWCRPAAVADSIPSLGTSICRRFVPKTNKQTKNKPL